MTLLHTQTHIERVNKMKFMILDSRASYSYEDASIIEFFEADNLEEALEYQEGSYSGQDTVLEPVIS